ncbi:SusC/RagA family TonB-linked outer membrane protein [Segetibacter sp. 3557_3]|uniref:SusC/RagA family TonB-linked outer membrane protein n=1 Tax=Segetibacter sp. 3557_3 TaxID=2547429 RepID=UPI001404BA53|nr:SusC/RagA family TonB-linked outer membrane protein [Segetibacter sp. 3557_3]
MRFHQTKTSFLSQPGTFVLVVVRIGLVFTTLVAGNFAHAQVNRVPSTAVANSTEKVTTINGLVREVVSGKPIESARITYGDRYAAISDSSGRFTIGVPDTKVALRIEADGYQPRELALRGKTSLTVQLYESDFTSVYDDVTTPFDVIPQSHAAASIVAVQNRGNWSMPETADALLQGKVAGFNSIRRSGTANMGADMFLRGFNSLYATNQPLIIVDGVYFEKDNIGNSLISGYYNNPLSFIDLKDVDNISVIKDGASIYGAKGANGVILITTARAKQEATKIDLALYGDYNLAPQNIPVLNASDYRVFLSEMLQSKGLSYNEVKALPYMNDNPSNPDYYRYHNNLDWQKKVFRNSFTQNAYLKITGGDNIAKYALSIGFLKNQGNIQSTGLNRYNTRFNADLNLSRKLTASANLSFLYYDQTLKNFGINNSTNPIYTALVKSPLLPTNELSDEGISSPALAGRDSFGLSNPAAIIDGLKANNKSYRFTGMVGFNYQFNNNLALATTISVNVSKTRESFFVPETGIVSDTLASAIARNRSGAQVLRTFGFFNDTRLSYSRKFGGLHELTARLGARYNHSNSEQDFGLGFNAATDQFTGVGFGVNALRQIGGSLGEWAWLNTYLNVDYNFAGKYFLSLNASADGSSRFGDEIKSANAIQLGGKSVGLFPSLSAAWLISSENFMAGSHSIDLLKLRLSAGLSGNDDIGNFTARKFYVSQNLLGISGLVQGNPGNPQLQYEAVTRLNAGVDVAVLNERLSFSIDGYQNTTNKMIVYEPAPSASGLRYNISNSGAMQTTGWDASVNGRIINKRKLKWDVGFNIAHYKSVITKLPAGAIVTSFAGSDYITGVNGAPNLFYGFKSQGVFTSDAAALAAGLVTPGYNGSTTPFKGGDMHFVNTDASNNIINENDRQVIGDPNPDFFGSFNTRLVLNDWSLDALFTFSQGNDVYNYARRQLESMRGYANQTQAVINRWRSDGQVTPIPKASWGDPVGNSRFSDRWIEDGSYLRLRSLSVSYTIPFKPGIIKSASVYATGNNLVTFTRYLGYDPEFSAGVGVFGQGTDIMLEPQYRTVQLGMRVGL